MINPICENSDYLEFECSKCKTKFHNAIKISHDAPTYTDAQKYDIRNWNIMKIHLECPKCKDKISFKLAIRNFDNSVKE